jgi:Sec-independent protein secretion pathway component TatC
MELPIILLYEISIQMAKLVEKKKAKQDSESEEEFGGDDSGDET